MASNRLRVEQTSETRSAATRSGSLRFVAKRDTLPRCSRSRGKKRKKGGRKKKKKKKKGERTNGVYKKGKSRLSLCPRERAFSALISPPCASVAEGSSRQ